MLVEPAGEKDLDALVRLESALFRDDACRFEPLADSSWPGREAANDFRRLLAQSSSLVLVARSEAKVVGHLVGYAASSSPTRLPASYAILRSMFVDIDHRRDGVGSCLVEGFVAWAQSSGCVEAHVDSYALNTAAQSFYERHGFATRSISRVRPMG